MADTTNQYDDWDKKQRKAGEIPQKYKDMLLNVLDCMELETGNMYQFTVHKFGNYSNQSCIIGNFNTRPHKIEVYDMDQEYKELEDIYDNREQIYHKIKLLNGSESFYDFKEHTDKYGRTYIIGKCKICHSYNDNVPNRCANSIDGICQNEECPDRKSHKIRFSKWSGMQLDNFNNHIYISSGGSVSVCHDKGKWRYIK
ncbi:hypothetical protein QKU48_gp0989 [Fadolivirus algeromassiliense]|jgi:hypothetical protein|uniref:Uncharacterized protein n=1 Tax=Fadolivirus FV1/VV64 TaxID=3070911 RepID=A0A7D3QUT9_9VIRU|nr:hypothetical protein QKU48_gp0989 [Fadolivirus algeromassiliense]QKF94447.1 hypothetical protein Fadolivirus_1_989 [Fadolivirus FV1/VV64]